jgi:hypothetical protein
MAWLKANPIASPSLSLVSCKQLAPPQNEFIYGPDHPGKKKEKKKKRKKEAKYQSSCIGRCI